MVKITLFLIIIIVGVVDISTGTGPDCQDDPEDDTLSFQTEGEIDPNKTKKAPLWENKQSLTALPSQFYPFNYRSKGDEDLRDARGGVRYDILSTGRIAKPVITVPRDTDAILTVAHDDVQIPFSNSYAKDSVKQVV